MNIDSYDVVVVGSGLTGGWAAKTLTEGGARVLLLDAGSELTLNNDIPEDSNGELVAPTDPSVPVIQAHQPIQSKHRECTDCNRHLFVNDFDHPYETPSERPFFWIRGRQVGGRSLTWAGLTLRYSDLDFQAPKLDSYGQAWPFTYKELDPFYTKVEQFMGVYGNQDGIAVVPDGAFLSAKEMSRAESFFKKVIEGAWAERRVIIGRGIERRPRDISDTTTHYWPAFSSQASTLKAAFATGRLTLRSNCIVEQLLADPTSDLVTHIVVVDRTSLARTAIPCPLVVLCASTLESTRILLNSSTDIYQGGLGNSSGVVGKYLMDHPTISVEGIVPGFPLPTLPFGGPHSIYIPRFRNLGQHQQMFLRGYGIWGGIQRQFKGWHNFPNPEFGLYASCEMLPESKNHVYLSPTLRDRYGIPVLHIDCSYSSNEFALAEDALTSMREMVSLAGFEITNERSLTVPGLFVHEVGTIRMGSDPKTSALSPFNQSWDIPNLFVTDGSCFVSCGSQNPSLTMMAITARTCQFILKEVGRGNRFDRR